MDQNQQPTPTTEQPTPVPVEPTQPVAPAPQTAGAASGQTPPPPQHKRGSYLSGKTTALILVLAAVALFFLFLAITPQTPTSQPAKQAAIAPTPVVQTVLALESVAPTSSQAATKTVNVTIDTGKNVVNIVQLELAFDPMVISNVTITPGTFLKSPVELTKGIDNKNGRISYALGIAPSDTPVKGKGVLATISFQFQPTASVSSTTISFLPKTLVGASGMNTSALKSAKSLQLSVPVTPTAPKATPLQTATPSSTVNK